MGGTKGKMRTIGYTETLYDTYSGAKNEEYR